MFSDALKTAGELDVDFAAAKELKGPLHGVPISFKDLSESVQSVGALGVTLIPRCSRHQRLRLVNGVYAMGKQTRSG